MREIIGNTTATPNPVTEQYVTDAITNIMTESIVIGEGEAADLSIAGGTTDTSLLVAAIKSNSALMEKIKENPLGNTLLELLERGTISADDLKNINKVLGTDYTLVNSKAGATMSIALGASNESTKVGAVTFGYANKSSGFSSSAIGSENNVTGGGSLAYGHKNTINGDFGAAFGQENEVGYSALASGIQNKATGKASFASGYNNTASAIYSTATGDGTTASGNLSHAEGLGTTASGDRSHAEGSYSTASGTVSHAEGANTKASATAAHAEGYETVASGEKAHAEGYESLASGEASHAEGISTQARAKAAHAEGANTIVEATAGHTEGAYTEVYSKYAHAGGVSSWVDSNADNAFVHGDNSVIKEGAKRSVAFGFHTEANYPDQFVIGRYNDSSKEDTVFAVGNGTNSKRKNAFEVRKDGTALLGGKSVATETYVDKLVSAHNKRITNLEHRLDNTIFTTDDTIAYAKQVPEDTAPYAEVGKIGGTSSGENLWAFGDVSGTYAEVVNCSYPAGTYTLSLIATSSDTDATKSTVIINPIGSGKTELTFSRGTRNSQTFTINVPIEEVAFYASSFLYNSQNDTFSFSDIMLNKGSTALPYEPFDLEKAKVTEIRSASANLFRPFNIEPVTENGITMQYLPDEDCFVFNGSLSKDEVAEFYAPYHITTEYDKTLEVGVFYVSGDFYYKGDACASVWIDDDFHEDGGITGFYADLGIQPYYVESGSNLGPSHGEFEVSFSFWGGEWEESSMLELVNYKVRVHFIYGQSDGRNPKYAGAYNPNLDSLKIPAEVQALPDYGKTDTYIEWRDGGRFFVTPDGETDISHLLSDDNFIRVEGGGMITAVNEHGLAAPSKIVYQHLGGTQ